MPAEADACAVPDNQLVSGVVLRVMTDDEWRRPVADSRAEYEAHLIEFGGLDAQQAHRRARDGHVRLFPHGRPAPGVHLLIAEDTDMYVGHVWVAQPAFQGSATTAYLYDIHVHEDHRGRGYGRAIMQAIEQWASSVGALRLALNVFGGNTAARTLYESVGYEITAVECARRSGAQDSAG